MIINFLKTKSYIFSFLLMVGMILSVNIFAATPEKTLGFQGQFYTYNTPGNAPVNATFTFYDSPTGGNITGTPISKIIQVVNGYFGTTFTESDTTGVDLNQQLYLEISINGTTLSPRTTVNPTVSSLKSFGTFSYAVAPAVGPSGSLYFNSTSNELYVSTGGQWVSAGTSSSTSVVNAGKITSRGNLSDITLLSTTPINKTIASQFHVDLFVINNNTLYSINGASSTIDMYDISNPASPSLIATTTTAGVPVGLDVNGGNLYVLNKAGNGFTQNFQIFEIRGPKTLNNISTTTIPSNGTFATFIKAYENTLFTVSGQDSRIYNIANPYSPVFITAPGGFAERKMAPGNNYVYTTNTCDGSFQIYDVAKGATILKKDLSVSGCAESVRDAYVVSDRYVYADGTNKLHIIDVSSSTNPVIVNTINGFFLVNAAIVGNRMYTTRDDGKIYAYDITDKTNPILLGTIVDTAGTYYDLEVKGGYLYTMYRDGNQDGYIKVFDLGGINLSTITSSMMSAKDLDLSGNLHVADQLNVDGFLNVFGGIKTSGTISSTIDGTKSFIFDKNGNVGIGTSTPSTLLHVYGSSTPARITIEDNDSGDASTMDIRFKAADGEVGGIGDAATSRTHMSIWANGTSTIDFFTNGQNKSTAVPRLRINADGDIAIGSSTPTAKFTIVGTTGSSTDLFTIASSSGVKYLTVTAGGNVGIGTSNPSAKFDIGGFITAPPALSAMSLGATAFISDNKNAVTGIVMGNTAVSPGNSADFRFLIKDTDDNYLAFSMPGINNNLTLFGQNRASTTYIFSNGATTSRNIAIGTVGANDVLFATNGTERLRINSAGNVGIGTTTPTEKLSIIGNQYLSGVLTTASTATSSIGGSLIVGSATGNSAVDILNLQVQGTSQNDVFLSIYNNRGSTNNADSAGTGIKFITNGTGGIGAITAASIRGIRENSTFNGTINGSSGLGFSTYLNGSLTERLRITGSGNIGIGTTTPSQILVASGTIQSTALLGGATTLSTDANGNIIRTPSDSKLKTNVETLTSALDKVNQMRGVSYKWIDENRFGTSTEIGFIAQELETIVPEVVKSGGEYKSVNYQNLTALLTEAIKELSVKVTGFGESFRSKHISTDELCIGNTCVTEAELIEVLRNKNSSTHTVTPPPAPTPEPEQPAETPTSEPIPEPLPEPVTPPTE